MDDKVILLYSENGNDICPVCKNIIKNGIETNCGHTFCTACITNSLAFNPLASTNVRRGLYTPL